ncbi:MAG: hypothetical protein JWM85_2783, partial [Acidimicrobiaceae bacterium]|nr:hypothetical protein [Acidimicrobiaceae bacterium]
MADLVTLSPPASPARASFRAIGTTVSVLTVDPAALGRAEEMLAGQL